MLAAEGQPQDDFQTRAEETVSRKCDSRGDACMSSSALFSTTCGSLVQDTEFRGLGFVPDVALLLVLDTCLEQERCLTGD